jgi:hypothetical protein
MPRSGQSRPADRARAGLGCSGGALFVDRLAHIAPGVPAPFCHAISALVVPGAPKSFLEGRGTALTP